MSSRKLFANLGIVVAVLGVAAVTYLLTETRSSHTRGEHRSKITEAVPQPASRAAVPGEPPQRPPAAGATPRAARDHRTWMRELSDALIRRGDAHSLGAAALLMNAYAADFTDPAEPRDAFRGRIFDLIQRAAKSAPADAAVQSLAFVFCRESEGCDPRPYEESLASNDSANGWSAAGELRRANAAHDATKQALAVAQMARARRIDTHRAEIEALFENAIASVAVAPAAGADPDSIPSARRLTTTAMNASPLDPLDAATAACDRPQATEGCRTVARLLRESTDPILATQGLDLAIHLTSPGSREAAELGQAKRRENWQTAVFLRMPRTAEQNARFLRDRVPSAELRREVLLGAGVPLDPPADWPAP